MDMNKYLMMKKQAMLEKSAGAGQAAPGILRKMWTGASTPVKNVAKSYGENLMSGGKKLWQHPIAGIRGRPEQLTALENGTIEYIPSIEGLTGKEIAALGGTGLAGLGTVGGGAYMLSGDVEPEVPQITDEQMAALLAQQQAQQEQSSLIDLLNNYGVTVPTGAGLGALAGYGIGGTPISALVGGGIGAGAGALGSYLSRQM